MRTGLTALCKSISHEAAADNVTINNLLPERIDTDRQRFMAERMMQEQDITLDEARRQIRRLQADREPVREAVQQVHDRQPPQGPAGSCTLSHTLNTR